MNYQNKYLKYKNKYLGLKMQLKCLNQNGGLSIIKFNNMEQIHNIKNSTSEENKLNNNTNLNNITKKDDSNNIRIFLHV